MLLKGYFWHLCCRWLVGCQDVYNWCWQHFLPWWSCNPSAPPHSTTESVVKVTIMTVCASATTSAVCGKATTSNTVLPCAQRPASTTSARTSCMICVSTYRSEVCLRLADYYKRWECLTPSLQTTWTPRVNHRGQNNWTSSTCFLVSITLRKSFRKWHNSGQLLHDMKWCI